MDRRLAVVCVLLLLAALGWGQSPPPSRRPQLVVQTGHSTVVTGMAFAAGGRALATGSEDGTVVIWDVVTGAQLRTLKAGDEVHAIAVSPDGKTVAAAAGHNALLWDLTSGALLHTFSDSTQLFTLAFLPNGEDLVTASDQLKVWNLASGQETSSLPRGAIGQISCLAFSPDGKYMATGGNDDSIRVWDTAAGKVLYRMTGFAYSCLSAAFNADGSLLAFSAGDGTVVLWDVAGSQERYRLYGPRVREAKTESIATTVVTFSPDGKWLVGANDPGVGETTAGTIEIWDVATGKQRAMYPASDSALRAVAFSPDGKVLATGGLDHSPRILEAASGKLLHSLEGHAMLTQQPAFSPDQRSLAVFASLPTGTEKLESPIRVWDLASGEGFFQLRGGFVNLAMGFSRDGHMLASSAVDGGLRFWNLQKRGPQGGGSTSAFWYAVAFSPDGKAVTVGGWSFEENPGSDKKRDEFGIRRWDMTTGKPLPLLQGHTGPVVALAYSPMGDRLVSASTSSSNPTVGSMFSGMEATLAKGPTSASMEGSFSLNPPGDQTLRIWDPASGKELLRLPGRKEEVHKLLYSPDGGVLAVASGDSVDLLDAASGAVVRSFRGHTAPLVAIAFSPDGKVLASSSEDKTVRFWDVATGAVRVVPIEDGVVRAISSDLKLLAGASDTDVTFWDPESGRLLLRLTALDKSDWLAITPDGLFDGSPGAWEQILWRFNNDTFDAVPVELFFNEYYYPGLVADILSGKRPKATTDIADKDRRQPRLKLSLAGEAAGAAVLARQVKVKVEVQEAAADAGHAAGSGVRDLRLFRNGSLVAAWRGQLPLDRDGKTAVEATITLVAGDNRLTAYAFNHDNIKSADAALVLSGADSLRRQGTAYILAVGINRYSNHDYDLRYAVADAQDFSEELKAQQTKLKLYSGIEVVPMLDAQATRENLLWALHRLGGGAAGPPPAGAPPQFGKLQPAQPEDAVFIYYAGHGTAAGPRFYLIPHDLGYAGSRQELDHAALASILQHSVSDLDLQGAFETIQAGELVLVIDACNSGQALEAEEKRRGPMNSQGLAQLAYEKGMYILTAAQGYQAAQEATQYEHGLLTYALIEEGLKSAKADTTPQDGQISLREWLDYAVQEVPALQLVLLQEARGRGTGMEAEPGEEKLQELEKRSLQHPRVFYRHDPETQPLVVAKP